MSKVIVFGATSFIGKAFIEKLLIEKHTPIIVSRNINYFNQSNFKNLLKIQADFETINQIEIELQKEMPDYFVYLAWAGYGKSTNDYAVQIQNIKPLCDAVKLSKLIGCKRFLFSSSFSEFMISEIDGVSHNFGSPSNVYGSVKQSARIIGHALAKQLNIDFVSVAFANTFGPGDFSDRSPNKFIKALLGGYEINLTSGHHLYDWNFINDSIEGLFLALFSGKKDQFYYVGNEVQKPLKDIIFKIKDILKSNSKIYLGKYKDDYYLDYSSIDIHKLYNHTGYLPKVEFEKAILITSDWVKNNL